MEKLEKTVEEIQRPQKEATKTSYTGLELLDERKYSNGTSIRYWM